MAEDREDTSKVPREFSVPKPQLPPRARKTWQQGWKCQDRIWKFLCLFVSAILIFIVVTFIMVLPKVIKIAQLVQDDMIRLNRKVSQGLADAGHDRDFIRGEMFRQLEANNGSSCLPCNSSWMAFQGSCYTISLDNLNWTQANESCAQKEARLVIINSQAEQNFLTSIGQMTSWIGLFRWGEEVSHRWTDGSTPTYINWNSKEQDNNTMAPACVTMLHHGRWSNSPCESVFSYTCEKRQIC